jgi:hypothetical protein
MSSRLIVWHRSHPYRMSAHWAGVGSRRVSTPGVTRWSGQYIVESINVIPAWASRSTRARRMVPGRLSLRRMFQNSRAVVRSGTNRMIPQRS